MSAIDLPFLPAALWVVASACLIILILVIFAWHLYQRARLKAVIGDAASVAALAARKEALEAEIAELRAWLATQKSERVKLEGERRQQELARADMAQIDKLLADKRSEGQAALARMAELDVQLARRRQFHARLEAEIQALETQRGELEPLEKYVQEMRLELDQGKARLGQLAQEEIRAQSVRSQAQMLAQELADTRAELEPLRQERQRLRQYIDQARQSAAVNNERILEQQRQLRAYEDGIAEITRQKTELEAGTKAAQEQSAAAVARLAELAQEVAERQKQLEGLSQQALTEQTRLEMLIQLREERELEAAGLGKRLAALRREPAHSVMPSEATADAPGQAPARARKKAHRPQASAKNRRPAPAR